MKLIRTNQFNPLQLFDNMLNDEFFGGKLPGFTPQVNIKNEDKSFELDFIVPGFKKEDFKIEVKDNTLTVSSSVKNEKTEDKENFVKREFFQQSFSRSFTLPENTVNEEKISAAYNNGILHISLPKLEEAAKPQPKLIEIS